MIAMNEKIRSKVNAMSKKLGALREKYLPYNEKTTRRLIIYAATIYILLLVWALWLKFNDNWTITMNYSWLSKMTLWERFNYDLIPFQVRWDHFKQIMQFFFNAVAFAPFGVLLPMLFKKKSIARDLLICFLVSLGFELLQLFSIIGSFATADLIMNTLGYFIGLGVYHLIFKKMSHKQNVIFFSLIDIAITPLEIFAIIRTINNIEPVIDILLRRI